MSNSSVSTSDGKSLPSPTQDQQKKTNPLESNPLVRAIVSWITYDDFLAMKKIMAELRAYGKPDRASQGQSNLKLHPLLVFLLNNNSDVTQVDKNGHTILHHCLLGHMPEANLYSARKMKNDATLVKSLCEMGASVTYKTGYGNTPLGIALSNNRMDLVETMVQFSSAVPTDCDNDGNTILHILLEQCTCIKQRKDHNKRLFNAIDELLSRGANLNQPNNEGLTPVHLAAKPFNCEVLKELIRRGADLKCRTSNGDDFLMLACKNVDKYTDHLQTNLQWLLEQGFDVNSKNEAGFTPLHAATKINNLSLVKALVTVGADVHAKTHDGANPLHLAIVNYDYRIIRYYIESGVAFDRRNIVHGIKLMFYLPKYTRNDENAIEWLIEKGFDRHEDGDLTLLHLVACYGYAGIVERLIERGVDVHAKDETYGYTPLHLASMRCQFKSVPELHEVGLSFVEFHKEFVCLCIRQSTCFSAGLDPSRYKNDHDATVLALLKAGADVNAKDRCGRTALQYAARQNGESNLITILLRAGAQLDQLEVEEVNADVYDVIERLAASELETEIRLH